MPCNLGATHGTSTRCHTLVPQDQGAFNATELTTYKEDSAAPGVRNFEADGCIVATLNPAVATAGHRPPGVFGQAAAHLAVRPVLQREKCLLGVSIHPATWMQGRLTWTPLNIPWLKTHCIVAVSPKMQTRA